MSTSVKTLKVMDLSKAPVKTKFIITKDVIIVDKNLSCDEVISLLDKLEHTERLKYKIIEYDARQIVRM